MKKKILSLFLLYAIACEVNIGEGDDNDQNRGRGGLSLIHI